MEPFIYVIDIDGTIIGDIFYQVLEWEILSEFDPRKLKTFKQTLIKQLQEGILRPNLSEFITSIKNKNENSEFFVYTASDDKWAQFLVPCIEAACGCKFARPIFSRKHCINVNKSLKKSLIKIAGQIYTKLRPRYSHIFHSQTHLVNHMLLIDNNKVLVDKESSKAVICPTYNYYKAYDVLRNIDMNILSSKLDGVMVLLQKYDVVPHNLHMSPEMLHACYYEFLAKALKEQAHNHRKMEYIKREKFWLTLSQLFISLQNKKGNKDQMLKYINSKLRK